MTVLRRSAKSGRSLVEQVGRVGGLGKGERILGVRFLGDVGYVVTFRQIDPLYTIALDDPGRPRVLGGELKLLGYSAYLHPLGDGLLLGVGQDADGSRAAGSGPSSPAVRRQRSARAAAAAASARSGRTASSIVEWDHRAFLHWRGLTVLPMDDAAAGFSVDRRGIDPVGTVSQPGSIHRVLVAGGRLLTVSEAGITSSRLATLGGGAWLPFQEGSP